MQPTILGWERWRKNSSTWTRPAGPSTSPSPRWRGASRPSGSDDYANEALEQMRRERIRQYTEASGPLYFGRIDGEETLYVGRHAVWDADNDLLAVNWRAPAAIPFYAATAHDPQGIRRRRRLDIEDRTVLGFVDETLGERGRRPPDRGDRRGHHAPARGRDAPDHLDHHARPVRADQPWERGRARHPGRARHGEDRGRAAPRRLAALRRSGPHARGRARRRPERDLHPLHRAGAAGARGGRRRAAADRRADHAPARRRRRDPRARVAEGQRADRGHPRAAAVGPPEPGGRRDPVRAPARGDR